MAIDLYTGFVGSGKSYCATYLGTQIVDAPLGHRYVIANFPITPKKSILNIFKKNKKEPPKRWIYKTNDELTPNYLIDFSLSKNIKKESSILLIFDEASIPFNTRNWQRSDRMEWIQFLSQSRKFGYDVIFITQHRNMIDKQIRALCEYEVQHKKLNNLWYFKIFSIFRVTLFGQIRHWNGARGFRGTLKIYPYRKSIANRYDTLKIFDRDEVD